MLVKGATDSQLDPANGCNIAIIINSYQISFVRNFSFVCPMIWKSAPNVPRKWPDESTTDTRIYRRFNRMDVELKDRIGWLIMIVHPQPRGNTGLCLKHVSKASAKICMDK